MRFIRVHGRVVPLKDERGAQPYQTGYKKAAAVGAVAGAVATTGHLASDFGAAARNLKAMKFGSKAQLAGSALALGGIGYAAHKSLESHRKNSGKTLQGLKHYGAGLAGSVAGSSAVFAYAAGRVVKGILHRRKLSL